jgi:hypothetical protein
VGNVNMVQERRWEKKEGNVKAERNGGVLT